MRWLEKPFRYAALFTLLLVVLSAFVLLDAFVIPRTGIPVVQAASAETAEPEPEEDASAGEGAVITGTSYADAHIQITIETAYVYDTAVYVADIQVSDASHLKTALANGIYGRNIKQTTSAMAQDNAAIFAVNGDYYGFRNDGYVIRNGVLYRDVSGGNEDLVIDSDGNFSIIEESEVSAKELLAAGAWQTLSFGPTLINGGEIAVSQSSEVNQSMLSNPRTAIGQVSGLHYIVIVSDGRTGESEGLTLYELATLFKERGCAVAYNLDGGGSATMWFNGEIINNPTDGRSCGERKVSDIVYFR
jgi:exopolysaccharide biosynthesis protein